MRLRDIKKKVEENTSLTPDDGLRLADLAVSGKGAGLLSLARDIQRQRHDPVIELCAITKRS